MKRGEAVDLSDPENHLPLDEINIGEECDFYIETEEFSREKVVEIRTNCLNFYIEATFQLCSRLPWGDSFLKNLTCFDKKIALNDGRRDESFEMLFAVSERFDLKQDKDALKDEWLRLWLLDRETIRHLSKLDFDDMWAEISNRKLPSGEEEFPLLKEVSTLVRSLPNSNSCPERSFSVVTDVKTKRRNGMGIETLNSVCVVRNHFKTIQKDNRTFEITAEHLRLVKGKNLWSKSKEYLVE